MFLSSTVVVVIVVVVVAVVVLTFSGDKNYLLLEQLRRLENIVAGSTVTMRRDNWWQ